MGGVCIVRKKKESIVCEKWHELFFRDLRCEKSDLLINRTFQYFWGHFLAYKDVLFSIFSKFVSVPGIE